LAKVRATDRVSAAAKTPQTSQTQGWRAHRTQEVAGSSPASSTRIGLGAVYVVVAIWGFVIGDGDAILSIIPVNTEDNILQLLIGIAGIAAGAAAPATPAAVPRQAT
jgi:hypothetical protein